MKNLLLTMIFAAPLIFSYAASAQSLDDAVKLAIDTNPEVGVASKTRQATDQELRQARGLYLPQVDVVTGIGREQTSDVVSRLRGDDDKFLTRSDARIQLTQRVFNAYETTHQVNRQKARVAASAHRVLQNSQNVALDAITAYLQVLQQRDLYQMAKQNIQFHRDIMHKLNERVKSGVSSRADIAQTNARLARAEANMEQIRNDLTNAEAFYTRVIGQHPGTLKLPALTAQTLPKTLDDALHLAQENTPAIKAANQDIVASNEETGIASANYLPRVNLEADAGYNDNANGNDTYGRDARVMLRGRWNLYRGGMDRASRLQNIYRNRAAQDERNRVRNVTNEQTRQAWATWQAGTSRTKQLTSAVENLKMSRRAYQEQFDIGQRSLLDLLDTENELFAARGQLIATDVNRLVAGYRVLASCGLLLPSLQINAPTLATP